MNVSAKAKTFFLCIFLSSLLISFSCSTIQAGCIAGSCVNGQGTYLWPNGDKYVGEWKDGKRHGKGMYIWPAGDKYIGEWNNNRHMGEGKYIYPDGAKKYLADFSDIDSDTIGCVQGDCFDGYGTYTWPSGAQYVGYFQNGIRNGLGTYSFPNGLRIPGFWDNGEYVGRM